MDADDELALSPDQNDLLIDEGDDAETVSANADVINEALLDEDETGGTGDAVTSDIRGKVALSSQLNKSEGSALTDVLNKDPQLRKPVKLPQIPKLPTIQKSKKGQEQHIDKCFGNAINPAVKKLCKDLGLQDVPIKYSDADFQQIDTYSSFKQKFQSRIQLGNPRIQMSMLMKLLTAKWKDFRSLQEERKNVTGFLGIERDQAQTKPSVSLPLNRRPNCNDPRMKSVASSSSSSFNQNTRKMR